MILNRPLRTVALLARDTGLAVLEDALLDNEKIELLGVYTHGRLTKAEGGGQRPELPLYREISEARGFPLTVLDLPEARRVQDYLREDLDVLVCLSWKFILDRTVLDGLRVGGVNLHRGDLPKYAGLEPVRRAIEAGETRTAITAHKMVEEVDMGPEIARVWLDIPAKPPDISNREHADTVKGHLLALYAPLTRLAIDAICAGN